MSRQVLVILVFGALVGGVASVGLGLWRSRDAAVPIPDPAPVTAPARPPAPAVPAPATPRPATPRPAAPGPAAPVTTTPVAPATATLRIDSDVPGANVFIDRKFVGTAPVTAHDVQPGTRQINVSAPGFEGVAETLDVEPGPRDVVISLKTIRLNESIDVTHKHRIGSCTGRLIARPDGLHYETSHTKDGFRVGLLEIETFDVDFLENNLRVKIAGGRSHDFTDPQGKADALYLFHQAVEKVRTRLKQAGR